MESEIKTCPFCDTKAALTEIEREDGRRVWRVGCDHPKCSVHPSTEFRETRTIAIFEWNNRRQKISGLPNIKSLPVCLEAGHVPMESKNPEFSFETLRMRTFDKDMRFRFCQRCGLVYWHENLPKGA